MVPGTVVFLGRTWEYDASIEHLQAVTRRGDVVAAVPAWYGPLIEWGIAIPEAGAVHAIPVPGLVDADAMVLGAHAANNRRVGPLVQRRPAAVPRVVRGAHPTGPTE